MGKTALIGLARTLCLSLLALTVACGDAGNESDTVFVDGAAAAEGDGSIERPFRTVREALALTRSFSMIAIAGGTYEVPAWTFDAPLIIQGSLRAPTVLVAETGTESIVWDAPAGAGRLLVRELGFASGLVFSTGEIELATITVTGVTAPAITLVNASATLSEVVVSEVVDGGEGTVGDGVILDGGTVTWTGGSVTGPPDRALMVKGATATLRDLTLRSERRAALTLDAAAVVTASDIRISDLRMGVFVVDSSLTLDKATITGAQSAGLFVSGGSAVTVTDSTFTDCPQGHVVQFGDATELTLDGNQFTNAAGSSCVSMTGASGALVVRNNVLDTCAGNGISASSVANLVIDGNTIRKVLPDPLFPDLGEGITLIDATATVSDNGISDLVGNGLQVIRGSVTAKDNAITDAGAAGISSVEPVATRFIVTGNTITRATGAGVIILGSAADLTGNVITQTVFNAATGLGDGITFAQGADVNIVGNTSSDNGANGISFLDGASGEVRDNTVTGNAQYGILEICSGAVSSVTVGTNTVTGNTAADQRLCP